MDEKRERHLRRKAIRWDLQGRRPKDILQAVSRSRTWFSKWRRCYQRWGWAGLRNQSRRPHHCATRVAPETRRLVIRARRRLQRRKLALIGAKAIQRELRQGGLVRRVPSASTIQRILRAAKLVHHPRLQPGAYYPAPKAQPGFVLQAMDWAARYLEGGAKVYAFHTLDLQTRALKQSLRPDKSYATTRAHALEVWQSLGIPHALQLDNDSAFSGGNKTPRRFGQFVRLCLYVGLEPVFIPFGEAARNGEVEGVHSLWGRVVWRRRHFRSVAHAQRSTPAFEAWYAWEYEPPKLRGQTPAQAQRQTGRRRLTAAQRRTLPAQLPLTAGRLHFIRRVRADGTIVILNEVWHVSKRLAGQYVWATVWTHRQRLDIYYRRSPNHKPRQVKVYPYAMPEVVRPLRPDFARAGRRPKLSAMS